MRTATALVLTFCAASPFLISARAETTRSGSVEVVTWGKLRPKKLPRHDKVPVAIGFGGSIGSTDSQRAPQLHTITVDINRHGTLSHRGIPYCGIGRIYPSTTREALHLCGQSLVGTGSFSADVKIPEQSPFPSRGRILAFNGRHKGRPALLAHIYGTAPAPTSIVLPFIVSRARGAYGIRLRAALPKETGYWGSVTGISLHLHRRLRSNQAPHGYLAANCPAPPGFTAAVFPLARTAFAFVGGKTVTSVLIRTCEVRQ